MTAKCLFGQGSEGHAIERSQRNLEPRGDLQMDEPRSTVLSAAKARGLWPRASIEVAPAEAVQVAIITTWLAH
jgi:hypothetical protein